MAVSATSSISSLSRGTSDTGCLLTHDVAETPIDVTAALILDHVLVVQEIEATVRAETETMVTGVGITATGVETMDTGDRKGGKEILYEFTYGDLWMLWFVAFFFLFNKFKKKLNSLQSIIITQTDIIRVLFVHHVFPLCVYLTCFLYFTCYCAVC